MCCIFTSPVAFKPGFLLLSPRCEFVQVQWDEPSSIVRPDKVSPWEVEPLVATLPPSSQPAQRNKRARPPISPSGAPDSLDFGMGSPFIFFFFSYSFILIGSPIKDSLLFPSFLLLICTRFKVTFDFSCIISLNRWWQ